MHHCISQGRKGFEQTSFFLPDEIVDEFITQSIERCERSNIGFPNIIEETNDHNTRTYAQCPDDFSASELYLIAKNLKIKHKLLAPYDLIFNKEGMFLLQGFDPWRVNYSNKEELLLIETIFDAEVEHIAYDFRPFLYEKATMGDYPDDSDIMKLYNGARMASKRQSYSAAILFR